VTTVPVRGPGDDDINYFSLNHNGSTRNTVAYFGAESLTISARKP